MTALAVERSAVDKFEAPLYTLAEAARYIDVNDGTFRTWSRGYEMRDSKRIVRGAPVITALGAAGQRGPAAAGSSVTVWNRVTPAAANAAAVSGGRPPSITTIRGITATVSWLASFHQAIPGS